MSLLPAVRATHSATKDRVWLKGPRDETLSELVRSFPDAAWDDASQAWRFTAWPSACWRLLTRPFPNLKIVADDEIRARMRRFETSATSVDVLHNPGQPPIRNMDSWRHQAAAYRFAEHMTGVQLAMGMGTGKSKVTVDLLQNWDCQTTLILCPCSVRPVWRREFVKHAAVPFTTVVLDGNETILKKVEHADAAATACQRRGTRLVVVINYESACYHRNGEPGPFHKWSTGRSWDCVVCDESHRIKGHSTKVSKYAALLTKRSIRRIGLSGTVMPHSPEDVFAQYRFLDPGVFGTSHHNFLNHFAKRNILFPGKVDSWINQEEFNSLFALLAFRVGNEVLDLPPATHNYLTTRLCPRAQKVYDDLEEDMIAWIDDHGPVECPNALVKLLRLQQLTSGTLVPEGAEEGVVIDAGKEELLTDLLADAGEPVVVFGRFRQDLEAIKRVALKLGLRYGELSGSRKDALDLMGCMRPNLDVAGVQLQAGGVGVDLTAAAICVFYSIGFSLGDYEQALARVHRPGQTRPVRYYHLQCEDTIDEIVYRAVDKKAALVQTVLNALRR